MAKVRRAVRVSVALLVGAVAWPLGMSASATAEGPPSAPDAGPAGQAVMFDMAAVLNADVIVNRDASAPDGLDPDNDSIDFSNFAYLTQSAAEAGGCASPAGLPDDGVFAATADHPALALNYSDASDGDNA